MGRPPIAKPTPPKAPTMPAKPVAPAFVALPRSGAPPESDADLIARLRKLQGATAKAFLAAYGAMGDASDFAQKLAAALRLLDLPGDANSSWAQYAIHLARLGAEAYVRGIVMGGDRAPQLLFVDRLENIQLAQPAQQEQFFTFAIWRLRELAAEPQTLDATRVQLQRSIEIVRYFAAQLLRPYRLGVVAASTLDEHSQLLLTLMQGHYQTLLDATLASSATAFQKSVAETDALLKLIARAILDCEAASAAAPRARFYAIDRKTFRDAFSPSKKSDFPFEYFSRSSGAVANDMITSTFRSILRKRVEQIRFLDNLGKGHDPVACVAVATRAATPPPRLHDSASWQGWVRLMWDASAKSGATPSKRLECLAGLLELYFGSFTVHVPFDLAEGAKAENYLTRRYPRALTGALTHDCLVYATRWIFMLGKLFKQGALPREFAKARIYLVEMPAHVGVMIELDLTSGGRLLLFTNNQQLGVTDFPAPPSVPEETVAGDIYPGVQVALKKTEIRADPTNAGKLWAEIARFSDRKLKLPYDDPSEPFLAYLLLTSVTAAHGRELTDKVRASWDARVQTLTARGGAVRVREALAELKKFIAEVKDACDDVSKRFEAFQKAQAERIDKDIDAHPREIARAGATVVDTMGRDPAWLRQCREYQMELDQIAQRLADPRASQPLETFMGADPARHLVDDDFPADFY